MMTRTQYLLTKLAEECNELAQRCTKAVTFGINEVQPGQDLDNAERLIEEYGDLIGVAAILMQEKIIRTPSMEDLAAMLEKKRAKLEKYYTYSVQCGTVQPVTISVDSTS